MQNLIFIIGLLLSLQFQVALHAETPKTFNAFLDCKKTPEPPIIPRRKKLSIKGEPAKEAARLLGLSVDKPGVLRLPRSRFDIVEPCQWKSMPMEGSIPNCEDLPIIVETFSYAPIPEPELELDAYWTDFNQSVNHKSNRYRIGRYFLGQESEKMMLYTYLKDHAANFKESEKGDWEIVHTAILGKKKDAKNVDLVVERSTSQTLTPVIFLTCITQYGNKEDRTASISIEVDFDTPKERKERKAKEEFCRKQPQ